MSITPHQHCPVTTLSTTAADRKAETLGRVVKAASDFAKENSDDAVKFLLAAGTAGIEAATNEVARDANRAILIYVYLAVIVWNMLGVLVLIPALSHFLLNGDARVHERSHASA